MYDYLFLYSVVCFAPLSLRPRHIHTHTRTRHHPSVTARLFVHDTHRPHIIPMLSLLVYAYLTQTRSNPHLPLSPAWKHPLLTAIHTVRYICIKAASLPATLPPISHTHTRATESSQDKSIKAQMLSLYVTLLCFAIFPTAPVTNSKPVAWGSGSVHCSADNPHPV